MACRVGRLAFSVSILVSGAVADCWADEPVLFGVYPGGSLSDADPSRGVSALQAMDSYIQQTQPQRGISLAGEFIDPEFGAVAFNLNANLNAAWDNGYTPFVNLLFGSTTSPPRTAEFIASGGVDAAIRFWGTTLADWTVNGTKHAFIAPMPEMNFTVGGVAPVVYAGDPANFILAFRRMRMLFEEEFALKGVPTDAISWVFAPNSVGEPGHEFENYYPGHDHVDVVGFSLYNSGGCPPVFKEWLDFDDFVPFLDRMRLMAPTKPVFVTQTGTVDVGLGGPGQNKNTWLETTLSQLAQYEGLRGIMYFHFDQTDPALDPGCFDWRFLDPNFPGLRLGLADSNFVLWSAGFDLKDIGLSLFADGFESGNLSAWSSSVP